MKKSSMCILLLVQVFLYHMFLFLMGKYLIHQGISAWPLGRCIFNFIRNFQTFLQSSNINLYSYQQHMTILDPLESEYCPVLAQIYLLMLSLPLPPSFQNLNLFAALHSGDLCTLFPLTTISCLSLLLDKRSLKLLK